MKKIMFAFLLICNSLCYYSVASQYLHPSDIRISLLTVDPGQKFYSVFGHTAIRVSIDSSNYSVAEHTAIRTFFSEYDIVYNYAMFTFSSDLYFNWLRGRMVFQMSKEMYDIFMTKCVREKRSVREQVLEMDSTQIMFIIRSLEHDYNPKNRYYRYMFFDDNCTTRIRDLILQAYDNVTLPKSHGALTYRGQIHPYLKQYPWRKFIIDIVSGLSLDLEIDIYKQMFLADNINDIFARTLSHGQPIVKETINIFDNGQSVVQSSCLITPAVVCFFFLALSFLLSIFERYRRFSLFFDFFIFLIVGIIGVLITYFWFFSDHTTDLADNLNIIWALPTHFVVAFFLLFKRHFIFIHKYFLITAIISAFLIASWIFLPQRLNPALIPLVLAIVLRSWCIYSRSYPNNFKEM